MAFDAFLQIEGIPGESSFPKHKNEIAIESFSWGMSNRATSLNDFSFVHRVDKASPPLLTASCTNMAFPTLKLSLVKVSQKTGSGPDYLVFTMTDCLITGLASTGEDSSKPQERLSFNFQKIEMDYKFEKPDGTLSAPIHGECNPAP